METNWISVKFRLPEDLKNVLVTINYDDNLHIAYIKKGLWYVWIDDEIRIEGNASLNNEILDNGFGVISWCELPKRAEWLHV